MRMSEQEIQPETSDAPGREVRVVSEDTAADWEGYSPDTLAALLDP
jgi:hypothetical protein